MHRTWGTVKVAPARNGAHNIPLRIRLMYYISEFLFVPRCVVATIEILAFDRHTWRPRRSSPPGNHEAHVCSDTEQMFEQFRGSKKSSPWRSDVHLIPNLRAVTYLRACPGIALHIPASIMQMLGCYWPSVAYYVDDDDLGNRERISARYLTTLHMLPHACNARVFSREDSH